jgi:hypothetical protein
VKTCYSRRRIAAVLLAFSILLAAAFTPTHSVAAVEPLTLRVQDAIAEPGGVVAVVLRTYASRPIGQGQLCLMASPVQSPTSTTEVSTPLASYIGAVVFSDIGDAQIGLVTEVSADPQMILVQFASESGTVNLSDGPLAALFFRLDESVQPGSTFQLVIDEPNSLLRGPDGTPIVIESREGELTTRLPADPFVLQADGTRVAPGHIADLAVTTLEPFPMSEGQIVIRYDAAIARGTPQVRMNPRHGQSEFEVDSSTPGMLVVNFSSAQGDLNQVPGDVIQIDLPISRQVETGLSSRLWIDPIMSWVAGASGQLLPVTLEDDDVEFVPNTDGGGSGSLKLVEIDRSGTASRTETRWRAREQSRDRGATRSR